MARIISTLLDNLGYLEQNAGDLEVHGANLAVSGLLRHFAADPGVDVLEVFLPPLHMAYADRLASVAERLLPVDRRGKGHLRFYPVHSLPEVWADAEPRIIHTIDPRFMARDRYLRDRFALAPTAACSDFHALGQEPQWRSLGDLAAGPATRFDSIVALSASSRRTLVAALSGLVTSGPAPCRVDLIPRAVDTDRFRPASPSGRQEARRQLGLPAAGNVVLFLGRLTPNTKADLLPCAQVFAETSTEEDILLIAGREDVPGYCDAIRREAGMLGVAERVLLHGAVPAELAPLYYQAADIFVFPGDTASETFGVTAAEAMASGLPVIASEWNGMRDIVRHGETGFLVPTRVMPGWERLAAMGPAVAINTTHLLLAQGVCVDTFRLASAFRALLRSPKRRTAMGRAGRERALKLYSWSVILDQWHALWAELEQAANEETPDEAATRRARANDVGRPHPLLDLLGQGGTEVVDPSRHCVRLSTSGRAAASGGHAIRFYDEVVALVRQDVVDRVMALLASGDWVLIADLTRAVGAQTVFGEDDTRFHLGLLLKRGLLELAVAPQETVDLGWPDAYNVGIRHHRPAEPGGQMDGSKSDSTRNTYGTRRSACGPRSRANDAAYRSPDRSVADAGQIRAVDRRYRRLLHRRGAAAVQPPAALRERRVGAEP